MGHVAVLTWGHERVRWNINVLAGLVHWLGGRMTCVWVWVDLGSSSRNGSFSCGRCQCGGWVIQEFWSDQDFCVWYKAGASRVVVATGLKGKGA